MTRQVWFVTGTSSGFGLSTVRELLKEGYKVAATTRFPDKLLSALAGSVTDNLLPLQVDLTSEASIKSAIEQTIAKFGQLDVVVNNAGYPQTGAIEDVSRDEIIRQFELNFLAFHAAIQAVLPHFRSRQNGYILNVSSSVTVLTLPGLGIYTASKYAVNGYTDVLAEELAPFGIKVTTILPGQFDTGFAAGAHLPASPSDPYKSLYDLWASRRAQVATRKLPGSTELSAKLFIELANNPNPPRKIYLGKEANEQARVRAQENLKEIEQWKAAGSGVDVE
jgi:NAD(P)-dependent dehydrogenase (short-subunit alcohol dehydrogenase family)